MTVTVLSRPERRRRWTTTEKLRLVEETLAPKHMSGPFRCWLRQVREGRVLVEEQYDGARLGLLEFAQLGAYGIKCAIPVSTLFA
jgi:hypothetical protein